MLRRVGIRTDTRFVIEVSQGAVQHAARLACVIRVTDDTIQCLADFYMTTLVSRTSQST